VDHVLTCAFRRAKATSLVFPVAQKTGWDLEEALTAPPPPATVCRKTTWLSQAQGISLTLNKFGIFMHGNNLV
jgi:hypothetical protein